MTVPGLPPFSPLICYEVIFPGAVAPSTRPQWLLNVTNDAWFGYSAGPFQHLAAARLRAVEEGLPMARAAQTGVSVVLDAHGRVAAKLGLGHMGSILAPLPAALPTTLYSRLGAWVPGLLAMAAFVAPFLLVRRKAKVTA
ncbi:apolipoprotein N-acyltransferase [Pseudoroseomonas wenyumeiae]